MKILIITQNEPFFLAENLRYLIKILPKHSQIIRHCHKPIAFWKKRI